MKEKKPENKMKYTQNKILDLLRSISLAKQLFMGNALKLFSL